MVKNGSFSFSFSHSHSQHNHKKAIIMAMTGPEWKKKINEEGEK